MPNTNLLDEICDDILPVVRKLSATDEYSVTMNGSHSKGTSDQNSDYDISLFCEKLADQDTMRAVYGEWNEHAAMWKERGVIIDGIFPRTYAEVEEQMDSWLAGEGTKQPYVWTVWGYHILTEIFNQQILEDPSGRAAKWKERLAVYPGALKKSILDKHCFSLKYWRADYHYSNKVKRKDVVFLAFLTARLVHDMMQVIYALNEKYYPGDGSNLKYTKDFSIKPDDFENRIVHVFQISEEEDAYRHQYDNVVSLIDDTLALTEVFYSH